MTDLQMIRDLDDTGWPTPPRLQPAHDLLLAAIAAETHPPRIRRRRSGRTRRSWRRGIVGAVVAAGAATVLAVTLTQVNSSSGGSAHPGPADRPTSANASVMPPAAFLQKAAATAAAEPDAAPRADQFYYIRDGSYQAWLSMDGAHDGQIISSGDTIAVPGCRNGQALVAGNYTGLRPQPCTPQPAYLADAPTTPTAMAAYLTGKAGSANPNNIGKELMSIAEFNYLRPAARAALYEAVPLLPGLTLSSSTVLTNGTRAVAITWNFSGFQDTLLFNPSSYAYLGMTTSTNIHATANADVHQAIVDAVGDTA